MRRRSRLGYLWYSSASLRWEKRISGIEYGSRCLFLGVPLALRRCLGKEWCNRWFGRYNLVEHGVFRADQELTLEMIFREASWSFQNYRSRSNLDWTLANEESSTSQMCLQSMSCRAKSFGMDSSSSDASVGCVSCMNWISDMAEVMAQKHCSFSRKHDWICCRWQKTLERSIDWLPSSLIRLMISRIPGGTIVVGVSGRVAFRVFSSIEEIDMESTSLSWFPTKVSKPQCSSRHLRRSRTSRSTPFSEVSVLWQSRQWKFGGMYWCFMAGQMYLCFLVRGFRGR